MSRLISLGEAADPVRVGGKAAGLARLIAAGFRVPDGFVIPPDVDSREMHALLEGVLGAGPYAFRSSAAAEDLETASFAGQYETVLGVVGADAGTRAVERVRLSARQASVEAYRSRAAAPAGGMAVIVQRQIDAHASGVAFTRNPVTGVGEVVIEAVAGLGEGLMSGAVTPEEWTVSSTPALRSRPAGQVLDPDQAAEIAALSRRVEASLGGPQDVEWVIDGDGIWLLQARPITALPIEPSAHPNPDTAWDRSDAFFPEPVTPLVFTAWQPIHTQVTKQAMELLGLPGNGIAHGYFYGRVYDRVIPLVGGESDARGLPPAPLMKLLLRIHPQFRVRLRAAAAAARDDLPMRFIDEWEERGRVRIRARTRELRSVDLGSLTDDELAEQLQAVRSHAYDCGLEHFKLVFGGWVLLGQLGMAAERLTGWDPRRVIDLVQGHSETTRMEGEALDAVAAAVERDPAARALVEEGGDLHGYDGPAGAALRAYLDEYGQRVHYSFLRPTRAEDPGRVLSLLRSSLGGAPRQDPNLKIASAVATAELVDPVARPADRAALEEAVRRARQGRPYGDETERDTLDGIGLIRRVALEAGSRLAAQGRLRQRDDVVYLDIDELDRALHGRAVDLGQVERRRAEHRWALANPAPRRLGPVAGDLPLPSLFPASVQPIVGAFMWAIGHLFFTPPVPVDGGSLRGLGASAGVVEGTARVVRGHSDFHRIRHGDIVVCPSTMASWSSIFAVIGGLVTEVGGPLSHPGTLAREYGLPAVLGVAGATSLIADGDRIRIDGSKGTVIALDGAVGIEEPTAASALP